MLSSEVSLQRVQVLQYSITETTGDLGSSQVNVHHVSLGVVSVGEIFPTQEAGGAGHSCLVSHLLEILSLHHDLPLPQPGTFKEGHC